MRSLTARVLAGEHITHVEGEVVRTDGLPVPVWLSLCPVEDERGGVLGALVVARDVTEQHLAQARLAEVEVRLEESEAITHVGSWLWDLRTEVVQWSSEFHRIHGIDPHDFGGTLEAHLAVVHPDDRAVVRATMESRLSPVARSKRSTASFGPMARSGSCAFRASRRSDPRGVPLASAARAQRDRPGRGSVVTNQAPDSGHEVPARLGLGGCAVEHSGRLP